MTRADSTAARLSGQAARVRRRGGAVARRLSGGDEVIYLIAPSGFPNYGDEIIARAWLAHLAATRPRATVVLDCHSPGQACLLLRDVHPRALFVDTLWQLTQFANGFDPEDPDNTSAPANLEASAPWEWVARAATTLGVAPRLAEGVELLGRASTLHFLGGGYLNRIWPEHASLVIAAAAVAHKSGARLVATGQGLVPRVEGDVWTALVEALDTFTTLDVRDHESALLFDGRRQVWETGDDAWLTLSSPIAARHRTYSPIDSGRVILCLQGDLTEDFECDELRGAPALARYVTRILDAWEVPGDAITVIEGIPGTDFVVPDLLRERIAGSSVISLLDLWRNGLPAGAGNTWISTRFHPHLLAAAAGDSGVAIAAKADYYSVKHKLLTDAGSRWTVVSDAHTIPERPTAGGFDSDDRDLAIAVKAALAHSLYPRWPRRMR